MHQIKPDSRRSFRQAGCLYLHQGILIGKLKGTSSPFSEAAVLVPLKDLALVRVTLPSLSRTRAT